MKILITKFWADLCPQEKTMYRCILVGALVSYIYLAGGYWVCQ